MKYITLIIGLFVFGCGENRAISEWKEEKEARAKAATNTNKVSSPRVQPDGDVDLLVKELTLEEKVVGTYEGKKDGFTFRVVLLENGIVEFYNNGEKEEDDGKWKIIDGELHANDGISVGVLRINKDNSITYIARIKDSKREEVPKEYQVPLKKIQ